MDFEKATVKEEWVIYMCLWGDNKNQVENFAYWWMSKNVFI